MKRPDRLFLVLRKDKDLQKINVIDWSLQRRKAEKIKIENEPAEIVVFVREGKSDQPRTKTT